jgi:hypothetical protein
MEISIQSRMAGSGRRSGRPDESTVSRRFMSNDKRDVLEVLKFELNFLEQGGYGRSVRTPWEPTSIFQDSPSCINFNSSDEIHPCNECLLSDLVPADAQTENVPCHHIPLNQAGQTVHGMERQNTQAELEDSVKLWLRASIARIEQERSKRAAGVLDGGPLPSQTLEKH